MRIRFSLRTLLIGTLAVAAIAAFVALRQKPARIAALFQDAVQRGDKGTVAAMITGAGIEQSLEQQAASFKDPESWGFVSCDVNKQSANQWLRGVCSGQFVVEFYFRSEGERGGVSAYQECQYEVDVSILGVEIVSFTQQDPAVAVWSNEQLDTEDSELPIED